MAGLRYAPRPCPRASRPREQDHRSGVPSRGRWIDISSLGYILGASGHAQSIGLPPAAVDHGDRFLAALRTLVGQGRSTVVLLMEVQMDDPRIAVLTDADNPSAMIGRTDRTIETDWVDTDLDQCVHVALEHLAALGHQHVVLVPVLETGLGAAIRIQEAAQRKEGVRPHKPKTHIG